MLVTNPFSTLSGIATLSTFASIRWANFMRGMLVSFPSGAIGLACASYAFNVYSGRLALGAYSIMTWANLAVTLGLIYLGRKWGRSTAKDLIILTLTAVYMACATSLNHIAVILSTSNQTIDTVILYGVIWKILHHVVLFWVGYPIGRYFETAIKNMRGK
ncbi:MAG: hypothetical protein RBT33_00805 [Candidatus Dojkabacteria bacterium]|nr:hypothetical protein [Candidatus Dojkabacteria bacterium]MDX9738892.1 hypothetical protein [Candidatus Dojkabacteria bacterium]